MESSEERTMTPLKDDFFTHVQDDVPDTTTNDTEQSKSHGILVSKTANQCMLEASQEPPAKKLFGDFWYEEELCILFADTGTGKSILSVQIADSISKGLCVPGFAFESHTQSVLYFDLELTKRQFLARYSVETKHLYLFDDKFYRVEINSDAEIPNSKNFDDLIFDAIEEMIKDIGAKVVIVDNITYLKSGTEQAKDALPLMKMLKGLKNKYNLSMLLLAHTPKRNGQTPITRNDLQGSKMLINFCDSAFAIGESFRDSKTRYLKQIKVRNAEVKYDAKNVMVCEIQKQENFLQLVFEDFGTEDYHLKPAKEDSQQREREMVKVLLDEGKTQREIADETCLSLGKVNAIIQRIK